MASTSVVGPRGLSGMVGETAALFRQEYRAIQTLIQQTELRSWAPSSEELNSGAAFLRERIQTYAQMYLTYETTLVRRAQKLSDEIQHTLAQCQTRPSFYEGNWEYLAMEGVQEITLIKRNIKLMKGECIPSLQTLAKTAEKLYNDLSKNLGQVGCSLNEGFALAYTPIDAETVGSTLGFFWQWLGGMKRQVQLLVGKTPFLDRAVATARSKEHFHNGASAESVAFHKRQPASSLEEENQHLQQVIQQLKTITEEFGLTPTYST